MSYRETLPLTLSQTSPYYYLFANANLFENTVVKGEIALHEQFLRYPVFSTHLENLLPFYHIQNCRLQTLTVWKNLKFAVGKRVNCY